MNRRRKMMLLSGESIVYLFRDEFTTGESAPLTTPRACEPGPGTLTIVDTGNKLSIASGRLIRTAAGGTAWTDPRVYGGAQTRAAGLAFSLSLNGVTNYGDMFGWRIATTGGAANIIGALASGTDFYAWIGPASGQILCGAIAAGEHKICSILRASGSFIVMDGNLIYVNVTSTATPVYPSWQISDVGVRTTSLDYMCVRQLPAPWNSDYGVATGYVASPSSGEELTHEADCSAFVYWTAATGAVLEFDVRRTDADNRWVVRCDQSGSTIKLIERNAGTETERSSAAQTFTDGAVYVIQVMPRGTTIRTAVISAAAGANKNAYTSATFNQTATLAKVAVTGGTLANFVTWPYTLSGSALSVLGGA